MAETTNKFNFGDFFSKNFAILIVAVIFFIWYMGCGDRSGQKKDTSDTTRTQVLQPIVINPAYQPQQSGNTVYVPIPQRSQRVIPAATMDALIAQVKELSNSREALAKEYYAIKNYNDSITLRDTAGTRVGVVNLKQQVSENTLKSTQPSYQLLFPQTTITNTVYPEPKSKVFAGGQVQTAADKPSIQQLNAGFLLENKKENVFALHGTYNFPLKSPGVSVGYYGKLRFNLFGKK